MDLKLHEKVVIITGGTSGIGEACVFAFAHEGAIPVIVGRSKEKADKILEKLRSLGLMATFIQADLENPADCKMVVDKTLMTYGKINALVNNAGVNDGVKLESSVEDFMASINKNLMHYFAMVKYCKRALIETKGVIINVGSKVADTGQGGTSGYAASKGGIHALTREWAVDFAPHGVRVNEVIPAETWTPLYDSWVHSFDNPEEKINSITKNIPLGKRFTTSDEIADMVVFLASSKSSHTTGQLVYVDGGYTHLDRSITAS